MFEYVRIGGNMREYTKICLNGFCRRKVSDFLFCFRLNKVPNLVLPLGTVNLDISNKYIYDASLNDLFIYCCCRRCFYTFWWFKGLKDTLKDTLERICD